MLLAGLQDRPIYVFVLQVGIEDKAILGYETHWIRMFSSLTEHGLNDKSSGEHKCDECSQSTRQLL